MDRAIAVISTPKVHAWLLGWLNLWGMPVMADPKWNEGDYYGKDEPIQGLANGLKLVTLSALGPDWADQSFDRKWADTEKSPLEAMRNQFLVEKVLADRAMDRAKIADANSMLYLIKACALFDMGREFGSMESAFKKIRAKVLMIGADTDLLFPTKEIKSYLDPMSKAGLSPIYYEIKTGKGHLGGILDIGQAQETIAKFMGN